MRWWRVLMLPVILAGVALAATPAQAHVSLRTSSPGNGDTLSQSPGQARLVFSDPLNPELSRVLARVDGTPVETGPPRVKGETITLSLPDAAGRYEIIYRVIAQDGHRVDGQIRFTVTGSSAAPTAVATPPSSFAAPSSRPGQPAEPTPAKDAGDSGSSSMWWLAGLGTVLVLSLLAYVFTNGRNRDKDVTNSVGTSGETGPPDDRSAT